MNPSFPTHRPDFRYFFSTHRSWYVKLCLFLLLTIGFCTPATAAPRKQQPFFRIGNINQSVALDSTYSNGDSSSSGLSSSSSTLDLSESYHLGFRYALYDKSVFNGNAQASVLASQYYINNNGSDTNSNVFRVNYHINGNLFNKQPYPISFYSYSQMSRAGGSYTPSYSVYADGQGASLSLNNSYIPASFSYGHNTSSSQGASSDSESFSISASHGWGYSTTGVGAGRTTTTTHNKGALLPSDTTTTSFNLSNQLLKEDQRRTWRLTSRYRYEEEEGTRYRFQRAWDEDLYLKPGKSLLIRGTFSSTRDIMDTLYRKGESASASIGHTLFYSLRSSLSGYWSNSRATDSRYTSTGGEVRLAYMKKLPQLSNLSLSYACGLRMNDQESNGQPRVPREDHQIPTTHLFPQYEFELVHQDVIVNTIELTNGNNFMYTEGVHYSISTIGRVTTVIFDLAATGGLGLDEIKAGDTLRVAYHYRTSAQLSYNTISHSTDAMLTLYGGRYTLNAGATYNTSTVTAGTDTADQTYDTLTLTLGGTTHREFSHYNLRYYHTEQQNLSTDSIGVSWQYNREMPYGLINVGLQERYGMASSTVGGGSWVNTFVANARLNRIIYGRINMLLSGLYTNRMTPELMSNNLALAADLSTYVGRTYLALNFLNTLSFSDSSTTRNTQVGLHIRRRF